MRKTDELLKDLKTTTIDVNDLDSRVEKAQDKVKKAIKLIKEFEEVDDNITSADKGLKSTSIILTPFTALPVVGTVVSSTKKTVDATKKIVSPIRIQSNKLDKVAKRVRPKLESFDKKITSLRGQLKKLGKKADGLYDVVKPINDCAVEYNSSTTKKALDEFSLKADPYVDEVNSSLKKCISLCKTIEDKANAIEKTLKKIINISHDLSGLLNVLEDIEKALKPIMGILKKKISIPYSFKIKVDSGNWWKIWEWGWKTVSYTFSTQQIIDGINSGIKAVNDMLMKAAKKLLGALHIKMPTMPNIPGLSSLKKLIDSLFNKFDIDNKFEDLHDELREIIDALKSIEALSISFNLKCDK